MDRNSPIETPTSNHITHINWRKVLEGQKKKKKRRQQATPLVTTPIMQLHLAKMVVITTNTDSQQLTVNTTTMTQLITNIEGLVLQGVTVHFLGKYIARQNSHIQHSSFVCNFVCNYKF